MKFRVSFLFVLFCLFIVCHIQAPDGDTKTATLGLEKKEREKESLTKLISLTKNITTWRTIKTSDKSNAFGTPLTSSNTNNNPSDSQNVYIENENDSQSSTKNLGQISDVAIVKELNELYETMNYRMYDVQCTYAYYAKMHLEIIFDIKDELIMYEDVFKSNLNGNIIPAYWNVALKTLATIHNMNYRPANWMVRLKQFLRKTIVTQSSFVEELTEMLGILRRITSTLECSPQYSQSIVPAVASDKLKEERIDWTDEDPPWIRLQYQNHALETQTEEEFNKRNEEAFKARKPQRIDCARRNDNCKMCKSVRTTAYSSDDKTVIFNALQQTSILVNKNLSEILYLLHLNVNSLPHDNFDDFINFPERSIYARSTQYCYYYYDNRFSMDGKVANYEKEIQRTKILHDQVYSMMKVRLWNIVTYDEQMIVSYGVDSDITSYRQESGILANIYNSIMFNLECTYAYYAWQHLYYTQHIMENASAKDDKYFYKIVQLVQKYYEVSIMTIATIYNRGFQAPRWMVELIVYLKNAIKFTDDPNLLIRDNSSMRFVLKKIVDSCPCSNVNRTIKVPLEKIQQKFTGSLNKYSFKYLQLELCLSYLEKSSCTSTSSKLYKNILQIMQILNVNKSKLLYWDYKNFDPKSWLFGELNIDAIEIVSKLRWDVIKNKRNDKIWENVAKRLSSEFHRYEQENDPINKIKLSFNIHNFIFHLMQTTMMRYILSFSAYCNHLRSLYSLNNTTDQIKISLNDSNHVEYQILCSERSTNSIINFANSTKSLEFGDFVALLLTKRINPDKFEKMFQMGIKKFNQFLIIMKLNSDIPVRPIWTQESVKLLQSTRPSKIDDIFQIYLKWIKEILTNANTLISNFNHFFGNIDFSTYNLVIGSISNLSMHAIYTK